MLYHLLKILISFGMRLYYREIQIRNRVGLKHDGPLIIIANHPNTLMDAWIISYFCTQPIYYLTKGTFFNTPFKRWILGSLNMIPVNRPMDNRTTGVSNSDSFEACYKVLSEGKTLVIFPEGNSVMERLLRELKTGTARIALEALRRNDGNMNLGIVPVGLFYSQANRFRSSVYVNVGTVFSVDEYLPAFEKDPIATSRALTARFREVLEGVNIVSSSKEMERLSDNISHLFKFAGYKGSPEDKAELVRRVNQSLEKIQVDRPDDLNEIQRLAESGMWQKEQLDLKGGFSDEALNKKVYLRRLIFSILYLLPGIPLFIFGVITNIPAFLTTRILVPKMVTNVEYYAPMAVLFGLILYPLNYTVNLVLIHLVFQPESWMMILLLLAMPILGMFAFNYIIFSRAVFTNWFGFFGSKTRKEAFKRLSDTITGLQKKVFITE
jgi:1-acyl-sn-glycerol-3-phosphate acyltransferase